MALGDPIKLRLTPEKQAHYEGEAARLGRPLGTYLRERLEAEDRLLEELAEVRRELTTLRHAIEDFEPIRGKTDTSQEANSIPLETLLLLRAMAGPDRINSVRSELNRLGYALWTHDKKEK